MMIDRRSLLTAGGAAALVPWLPAWAQPISPGLPTVSGADIHLKIAHQMLTVDGKTSHAIGINGTIPGPLVRLKEGTKARIHVANALQGEDSSIHWHGLILPFHMDGVPGISFPGIAPGKSFTYEFPVRQSGTYWYHSHSGLQEQMGHYGPLIIDPADADPVAYDREHVILLSDHSALHPHVIFKKLKQMGGYFNYNKQTLAGLLAGEDQALKDRVAWGAMRMDPTDISDVTGSTYTYLINGLGPADNWTGLFRAGERVRLRIINASAMTTFNVRIPGLTMEVVQADGLNVRPVRVGEFQIAVAETYDVVVTPSDEAYSLIAESSDRSGLARATLAPRAGMTAAVPPLRPRPLATMQDMGMGGMDHGAMGHGGETMKHSMRDMRAAPTVKDTPTVQSISPMPVDRTGDPGQGLEGEPDVLSYQDLVALDRNPDTRTPSRQLQIHLTGNMERYMWAFDGVKMNEVKAPIPFTEGERVRVTLVNDTMMTHPIHLHGHFFELVTGKGDHAPRKHTVNVQPGGKATFDLTADAPGDWAFHCHLLYHMHAGMMQVVTVRPAGEAA
ncbi:copper resistance system multicopper oxidase [Sphingopyxis panaciterrae]|uniref:copper resistance system multicopper oxidase n=1 Tax=Sphingopyxis panaciterrae TaxID=363841 RepID=UPI001423F3F5|nr:copper resistance system multicopper oxidase [Sphingopyxis panaciterrae]